MRPLFFGVLGNMFWSLCHIHFPTELRFFKHQGVYLQLKLDVAFGVKLTQCNPQKVQRHQVHSWIIVYTSKPWKPPGRAAIQGQRSSLTAVHANWSLDVLRCPPACGKGPDNQKKHSSTEYASPNIPPHHSETRSL